MPYIMSGFLVLKAYLTSTLEIGGAAEVNQVPPQAPATQIEIHVYPAVLTDAK